jgi:hypothetical protein
MARSGANITVEPKGAGGNTMTRNAALSFILIASVASAHHSNAMFDRNSQQVLTGTVKEFQWTNPHCWIQLVVASPTGAVEWSIEMEDPRGAYRAGLRPDSFHPGDKISVTVHPAWDTKQVVMFVSATDSAGKPIGKAP